LQINITYGVLKMYKVYRAEDSIFIVKDEISVAISFGLASDALELEMAEALIICKATSQLIIFIEQLTRY